MTGDNIWMSSIAKYDGGMNMRKQNLEFFGPMQKRLLVRISKRTTKLGLYVLVTALE